ncbi:MAG: nucleoside recognition protein [Armatimonadetes bacterium]|nr:nucleoside recognition protein [Armatimonadota bacterium]
MLEDAWFGSLKLLLQIIVIVVPLMIVLEVLKGIHAFEWLAERLQPVMRRTPLSTNALFPLIVGLAFGLTYGAGVLIQVAREGRLGRRELRLILAFLAMSHAMIEDTIWFVAQGAGWLWMVFGRVAVSLLILAALGRWLGGSDEADPQD